VLQTLFYIPETIGPYPVFGFGLLLAVWAVASVLFFAWLVRRQGLTTDTLSYLPFLLVFGAVLYWLLPRILEPGLGLAIRGYGAMLLVAMLAGTGLCVWRARRVSVAADVILALAFWGFIPGIVGARLWYVAGHWSQFQNVNMPLGDTVWSIVNMTQGGLVVYGGLIGGLLGFTAFLWKERIPPLAILDICAPGILLGLGLGRIGCFLNGCCFGGACDLPWAVQFPAGSPPYVHQAGTHEPGCGEFVLPSMEQLREGKVFVQGLKIVGSPGSLPVLKEVEAGSPAEKQGLHAGQRLLSIGGRLSPQAEDAENARNVESAQRALLESYQWGPWMVVTVAEPGQKRTVVHYRVTGPPAYSAPIHPTQLYSTIDAFVLCLFLLAYGPFTRRDGALIAMFFTLYPVTRFLMEMIRTDEPRSWSIGPVHLNIGQVASLWILAGAVVLWIYILRKPPGKALESKVAGTLRVP
jgi:phosphatidylglycerol:prolipoprotein diacylglycerol transferase